MGNQNRQWRTLAHAGPATNIVEAAPAHVAGQVLEVLRHEAHFELNAPQCFDLMRFILHSQARTNAQRLVAAARWLHEDRHETFDRSQLTRALERAGTPAPKNPARDLATAVSAGWLRKERMKPDRYSL